jgi:hypothetical protein
MLLGLYMQQVELIDEKISVLEREISAALGLTSPMTSAGQFRENRMPSKSSGYVQYSSG